MQGAVSNVQGAVSNVHVSGITGLGAAVAPAPFFPMLACDMHKLKASESPFLSELCQIVQQHPLLWI